jgi:hypothetical protein
MKDTHNGAQAIVCAPLCLVRVDNSDVFLIVYTQTITQSSDLRIPTLNHLRLGCVEEHERFPAHARFSS